MIESLNENFIYWMLGTTLLALGLAIVGALTSRHLPLKQRRIRVSKFAAVGAAIVLLSLSIFKPYLSSSHSVEFLDELKAENLNSVEEIAAFEKKQTKNIERLKKEVIEQEKNIERTNLYYSTVIQLLSNTIAIILIGVAFRKKESESEEI